MASHLLPAMASQSVVAPIFIGLSLRLLLPARADCDWSCLAPGVQNERHEKRLTNAAGSRLWPTAFREIPKACSHVSGVARQLRHVELGQSSQPIRTRFSSGSDTANSYIPHGCFLG